MSAISNTIRSISRRINAKNIRDISDCRIPEDFSFYVQNPGRNDPSMSPQGHTSLYVLVPVPKSALGNRLGNLRVAIFVRRRWSG